MTLPDAPTDAPTGSSTVSPTASPAVSATKSLTVSRDGYDLHAQATPPTSDTAPWLVFGNSLVTDLSIWTSVMAAHRAGYGVLRYDQAGHGTSGIPKAPISFDDLGNDLLAVMDAARLEQAIYVGLSMGVPTGLDAVNKAPSRFTALVLSDGQAKTAPGGAAGWRDRIDAAQSAGMAAFASATADRWLTASASAETRARLTGMIAATPLDGFKACATALMDYDYADVLPRIACPTLLIAGAEDGAMPDSMATKLMPAISGSQMQVIENAGHVPCFEQPEAFAAVLSGFLSTQIKKAPA